MGGKIPMISLSAKEDAEKNQFNEIHQFEVGDKIRITGILPKANMPFLAFYLQLLKPVFMMVKEEVDLLQRVTEDYVDISITMTYNGRVLLEQSLPRGRKARRKLTEGQYFWLRYKYLHLKFPTIKTRNVG